MFCLIGGWWLCLIRMSPWCGRQAGCTHLFRSHCWTSVTGSHPAPQDSRKCSHRWVATCSRKFQVGLRSRKDAGCRSVFSLFCSLPRRPPSLPPQAIDMPPPGPGSGGVWPSSADASAASLSHALNSHRSWPPHMRSPTPSERAGWPGGRRDAPTGRCRSGRLLMCRCVLTGGH